MKTSLNCDAPSRKSNELSETSLPSNLATFLTLYVTRHVAASTRASAMTLQMRDATST